MTRVYLVRHGRAAAGWDVDPDPDLDELGRAQADEVASRLGPLGPLEVITSPLRRCRSTAAPLSVAWGVSAMVDPAVAEIPSPEGIAMVDRVEWLRAAMAGTWSELGDRYTGYRDAVVDRIRSVSADSVVFSHFVAINTVIGVCVGDDRLVVRRLDNGSVTVVDVDAGRLSLVEGGHEADTLIR